LGQLAFGERWLGRRAVAQSIVQEVITAVSGFRPAAEQLGVAAHSVGVFWADIERRLETLRRQR
jgi:hypothetical protein